MGYVALITWSAGALAGLYMLTVWLIENDVTGQHATPSQLRVPVIFGHLTLAIGGLAYGLLTWPSTATYSPGPPSPRSPP